MSDSNDLRIRERVSLAQMTSFGVGGAARYCVEVTTYEQLAQAMLWAKERSAAFFILGKGSNVLFDDEGFAGLVIVNKVAFQQEAEPGVFCAGAGYSFPLLAVRAARRGYGGLEFASGIPATVGGAVYMNAGANGRQTCDTLLWVDYIDDDGTVKRFSREQMTFGYRCSPFQSRGGSIAAAAFKLTKDEHARRRQIDIIETRKASQPLKEMSAGCVFKNPEGCESAGSLIDKCGWKGKSFGGAMVSAVHANFIVNDKGEATSNDVKALIAAIRRDVKSKTAIDLVCEVKIV